MDIEPRDRLPAPLDQGQYWAPGVTPDEHILCPNWNASWTNNSKWHKDFVAKFKKSAHDLVPACPSRVIKDLTTAAIKKLGGQNYKHLKSRYKNEQQAPTDQKIDTQQARRDERKAVVSGCKNVLHVLTSVTESEDADGDSLTVSGSHTPLLQFHVRASLSVK